MIRTLSKVALPALAAVAVGCGGAGSDEQQIRGTVRDWARAMADDHARACRLMTPELRAGLMRLNGDMGATTCRAMLDSVMALSTAEDRASMRRTRVTKVMLDGDRALVEVAHSSVTSSRPRHVRRMNGRWLMDTPNRPDTRRGPGG